MRMRVVAPDGRRGEAGDRGPAARQAGPQHGGRDQRPGARPGQTRVIKKSKGENMRFVYLLYADEWKVPAADNQQMEEHQAALGSNYEGRFGNARSKVGDPGKQ